MDEENTTPVTGQTITDLDVVQKQRNDEAGAISREDPEAYYKANYEAHSFCTCCHQSQIVDPED